MVKKVLITGMSGLIGGLLKDHLIEQGGYELTALNRSHVDGVNNHQADISDIDAISPAFEGQDPRIGKVSILEMYSEPTMFLRRPVGQG